MDGAVGHGGYEDTRRVMRRDPVIGGALVHPVVDDDRGDGSRALARQGLGAEEARAADDDAYLAPDLLGVDEVAAGFEVKVPRVVGDALEQDDVATFRRLGGGRVRGG